MRAKPIRIHFGDKKDLDGIGVKLVAEGFEILNEAAENVEGRKYKSHIKGNNMLNTVSAIF